jgi:hypothetical protein
MLELVSGQGLGVNGVFQLLFIQALVTGELVQFAYVGQSA